MDLESTSLMDLGSFMPASYFTDSSDREQGKLCEAPLGRALTPWRQAPA